MVLSDNEKILIVVILVGIVLYFVVNKKEPFGNTSDYGSYAPYTSGEEAKDTEAVPGESASEEESKAGFEDTSDLESEFKRKMTSRNTTKEGVSKSNYSQGNRNSKSDTLDNFFSGNNPVDSPSKGFRPSLENNSEGYAAYAPDASSAPETEKDKFNAANLMPKEKNGDWFDDPYEAITLKSPKLTNVYRPFGVQSSSVNKNPNYDMFRGSEPNPKYPVSPWGNSSIEPDNMMKSLC